MKDATLLGGDNSVFSIYTRLGSCLEACPSKSKIHSTDDHN